MVNYKIHGCDDIGFYTRCAAGTEAFIKTMKMLPDGEVNQVVITRTFRCSNGTVETVTTVNAGGEVAGISL